MAAFVRIALTGVNPVCPFSGTSEQTLVYAGKGQVTPYIVI